MTKFSKKINFDAIICCMYCTVKTLILSLFIIVVFLYLCTCPCFVDVRGVDRRY